MSNDKKKRKVGRPNKYDPKYCDMLIEHMGQGFSFESFAGLINVARSTIYEWEKIKEFSDAKAQAFDKCQLWWERAGFRGMFLDEKDVRFNSKVWELNMKNRFGWRDRIEQKHSGEITLDKLIAETIGESESDT